MKWQVEIQVIYVSSDELTAYILMHTQQKPVISEFANCSKTSGQPLEK